MIIKIQSGNDLLLDILHKNPTTDFGLYAKPLKNGIILGNAIDKNNYEIVFQDTKYSYLPEDSNSIDFQSYCNPLVVLNIIADFFTQQLKNRQDYMGKSITWLNKTNAELDNQPTTITIPNFYIHSTWYRNGTFLLTKYFDGITVTHQQGKVFELNISAPTVFDAVNLLAVTSLFTHITNEYGVHTWIDDAFAQKYARVLTNLENVPYFIFYLFIRRAIRTPKQFELLKPEFESYLKQNGYDASLSYYGTHQERVQFITKKLETNISIIDIGCGELQYFKKMIHLGFTGTYYAIDKDEKIVAIAETVERRMETNQIALFQSIDDCKTDEQVNIIITEVIEHNTPENAIELVNAALNYNFNKIIITTPNVSFNQFYHQDLTSRHDDHHFEWNEQEFESFIQTCIGNRTDLNCQFEQIGDRINHICPTQTVIISKK